MNKPERNLERLRKIVVKKALEGEKIKKVAHDYMVSRKFVYKWLKRFRENLEGEWLVER
ncbi:MAG: helix-turn-helix domain-containing protein [Candidatus Heimdallarchaeaceae archaeon]